MKFVDIFPIHPVSKCIIVEEINFYTPFQLTKVVKIFKYSNINNFLW